MENCIKRNIWNKAQPASFSSRWSEVSGAEVSVLMAILDSVVPTGQGTKVALREHAGTPSVLFLSLEDLIPDDTGSIVVLTGGNNLVLNLSSSERVVYQGIAHKGATSEQFDLSGMHYSEFLGGTKLFYDQKNVRLILRRD